MIRRPLFYIPVLLVALLGILLALFFFMAPQIVERAQNRVMKHAPYIISSKAKALHQTLVIGDMHADSTLWKRDLLKRADRGHVDIPRLVEGNVALQVFTTVTKSPCGQNYKRNTTNSSDNITLLAIAQAWPVSTWSSLTERALYQAGKLRNLEARSPENFMVIRNLTDLNRLLQRRKQGESTVGALLGIEGAHALDGKLGNIQTLYNAGFRLMGLQHFFDNKLGGSLHGDSGSGLSEFGAQVVEEMRRLDIMIDVAHSSPQVVEDILSRSDRPLIVSHTGFYGHCPGPRNISDDLMKRIAHRGGLIGVGYWRGAVCDANPASIVQAIRYGIDLIGIDHVALGSDFDGAVATRLDASELAILTEEMLKAGFTEDEIRKVMGGNMVRFLSENLPEG